MVPSGDKSLVEKPAVVSVVTCGLKSLAPADLKEAEDEVNATFLELSVCHDVHQRCLKKGVWKPIGKMAKRITAVVGRVEDVTSRCTFDQQQFPVAMLLKASDLMNGLALSRVRESNSSLTRRI
jgi:hypothetical protein